MKKFVWLFLAFAISCTSNKTKVTGDFKNAENSLLTFEKVLLGKNKILDTLRLSRGKFSFSAILPKASQEFFQLQIDSLPPVLLLLSPNEKVVVTADVQGFPLNLQISGSAESEQLLLLQKQLWAANQKVDSLLQSYLEEKDLQRQLSKIFVQQKQFGSKFIVTHLGSLTTAVAYYQKLGKSLPLFGDVNDRFLLVTMLDSLRRKHPKSPYVATLERDLDKLVQEAAREQLQERLQTAQVLDKPEIALRDINGKEQSLNQLRGQVVLLQFWTSEQSSYQLDNRELLNLYNKFQGRKFQIYQVSLDTDSAKWQDAVRNQQLRWINVCSFLGRACNAARNYNVTALPSNFLINKKGEIVAKNIFDKDLEKQISLLVTQ
jgi:peroxiredoxin